MLYLNSIENSADSHGLKVVIAHERLPEMQNVPELAPSDELQAKFDAGEIDWQEFHDQFLAEMRQEYGRPQSRLKRLAQYSLKNDVTLHSADPHTEGSLRGILREIINGVWASMEQELEVVDLAPPLPPAEPPKPSKTAIRQAFERKLAKIAADCEHFSRHNPRTRRVTCELCAHYDAQIYGCPIVEEVFIEYRWERPEGVPS